MAAGGLKKKYINMAKKAGGTAKTLFKRAWKLQKAKAKSPAALKRKKSKKKVAKKVTRKVSKKRTVKKTTTKRVTTMAKRKKSAAKAPKRRSKKGLISQRTQNILTNGLLVGGSAVGTTWAVNMIPMVKDQASWLRALIQAALGVTGLTFSRDKNMKTIFVGSIVGSAISLILPLLPADAKIFGGARRFSEDELLELQYGARTGKPMEIAGKPMKIAGRPANIMGGYPRGTRNYLKNF